MTSTQKPTGEKPNDWSPAAKRQLRPWLWPAYRQRLLHSDLPILAGPFRGELGFEALYWLPFLAKLRADGIAKERLIPITRGGAGCWYEVPQGIELYAMRSPQEFRIENRKQQMQTGLLKQTHVTPWDKAVIRDAAESMGLTKYLTLHPSWMYQLCMPFYDGKQGLANLFHHLRFETLPLPPLPDGVELPKEFVAVKFYGRPTFPVNPTSQQFVEQTIKHISQHHPVIVFDGGTHIDDHVDFRVPDMPNVIKFSTLMPHAMPENNLALQSAVLARSLGFVGTYGGFAHLALRFLRPVVSFYWEWTAVSFAHRAISEQLASLMGTSFSCLRVLDIPMLQAVFPAMQIGVPEQASELIDVEAPAVLK